MQRALSIGGLGAVLLLSVSSLPAVTIIDLTDTAQPLGGTISPLTGLGNPVPKADPQWWVTGGACPTGAVVCDAGTPFPGDPFASATGDLALAWVPLDGTIIPVGPFDPWVGSGVPGGIQNPFDGVGGGWIVPTVRNDGTIESPGDPGAFPNGTQPLQFGGDTQNSITYYYMTEFTLDPGFTDVTIAGLMWADGNPNAECSIFLNSFDNCVQPNPTLPGQPWAGAGTGFVIDFALYGQFYQEGINRLVFVVDNAGWESGLRVDFTTNDVTYGGNEIPEPATYALFGAGFLALAALRRRKKA